MDNQSQTTVEIVRRRLANGRTIADHDVHQLVAEIDRLRARVAELEQPTLPSRITSSDLLLGGWHRISDPNGTYWCYPSMPPVTADFVKAAKLYKQGVRDAG